MCVGTLACENRDMLAKEPCATLPAAFLANAPHMHGEAALADVGDDPALRVTARQDAMFCPSFVHLSPVGRSYGGVRLSHFSSLGTLEQRA